MKKVTLWVKKSSLVVWTVTVMLRVAVLVAVVVRVEVRVEGGGVEGGTGGRGRSPRIGRRLMR